MTGFATDFGIRVSPSERPASGGLQGEGLGGLRSQLEAILCWSTEVGLEEYGSNLLARSKTNSSRSTSWLPGSSWQARSKLLNFSQLRPKLCDEIGPACTKWSTSRSSLLIIAHCSSVKSNPVHACGGGLMMGCPRVSQLRVATTSWSNEWRSFKRFLSLRLRRDSRVEPVHSQVCKGHGHKSEHAGAPCTVRECGGCSESLKNLPRPTCTASALKTKRSKKLKKLTGESEGLNCGISSFSLDCTFEAWQKWDWAAAGLELLGL